ncbi:unnamed protein product [Durusdinium trenchii]|uniref:Uncharacterized protein n=2 Tax=Durusdinium trenchii TaxID=1381693 RepID=A0ABP0R1S9_9DINO
MSLAFGWQAPFKRLKTAPQVHQELGSAFAACEEEIEDELLEPNLTANITGQLEDAELKRKRLRSEGSVLAQAERYAEALQHWEEALLFTDDPCEKAPILEQMAQVLLILERPFDAIRTAPSPPMWQEAPLVCRSCDLGAGFAQLRRAGACAGVAASCQRLAVSGCGAAR